MDVNAMLDQDAGAVDLTKEIASSGKGMASAYSAFAFAPATGKFRVIDRTDGYRQHRIAQVYGRCAGAVGVLVNLGSVVLLEKTTEKIEIVGNTPVKSRVSAGGDLYPGCTLSSYGPQNHRRSLFQHDDESGKQAILDFRAELAKAGLEWFQTTGQKLSTADAGDTPRDISLPGLAAVSRESVGA